MYVNTILPSSLLVSAVLALPSFQPQDTAKHVSMPLTRALKTRHPDLDRRYVATTLLNQVYSYYIDITIGTPAQSLSIQLDTGSSDIWAYSPDAVGACNGCTTVHYDPNASTTSNAVDDLGEFSLSYGTPNSAISGYFVSDILRVGGSPVYQIIAVVTEAHSGDSAGGIFGIGLPLGESVVAQGKQSYPGYVESLYDAGLITVRGYSIFLGAKTAHDATKGTIIFGAYDSTKYTGDFVTFPMVEATPDGGYRLAIAAPAISYRVNNDAKLINPVSPNDVVVMDTGTALTYIPVAQFNPIATAVSARPDPFNDGLYTVTCNLANNDGGVTFNFAGPNGDVGILVPWSELVIQDNELTNNNCYLGVAPHQDSSTGGTYLLGDSFLRSVYIVYNFDQGTISIGQANYGSTSKSRMMTI